MAKLENRLEQGAIPRHTAKTTMQALDSLNREQISQPLKVLAVLQKNIPVKFLEAHYAEQNPITTGKREVILSMYLRED